MEDRVGCSKDVAFSKFGLEKKCRKGRYCQLTRRLYVPGQSCRCCYQLDKLLCCLWIPSSDDYRKNQLCPNSDRYPLMEPRRPVTASLLSYLGFYNVMERAIVLYTGRESRNRVLGQHGISAALVCGGIWFYLDILREITDYPYQDSRLHVVPGRI